VTLVDFIVVVVVACYGLLAGDPTAIPLLAIYVGLRLHQEKMGR